MKNINTLMVLYFGFCVQISAQAIGGALPSDFFDPKQNPVAMNCDSTLQLIVSEYVLTKSVTTRLGPGARVSKMYKSKFSNGTDCLIFEGYYTGNKKDGFTLGITLIPDPKGKFYYSSENGIFCERSGCNVCGIENGHCVGCCAPRKAAPAISIPLSKVPTKID